MTRRFLRRARRGSYAIEFALLLPMLVLLAGGVVDTAYYLSAKQALVGAVQDGARNGAAFDHDDNLAAAVTEAQNAAQAAWDANGRWEGVTFTATTLQVGANNTNIISVRGTLTIDTFFGSVGFPSELVYDHSLRMDFQ